MLTAQQILSAALDLPTAERARLIEALSASIWLPPVIGDDPATRPLRPIGLARGEFRVPDDFDDPLPDEILDAFEAEII